MSAQPRIVSLLPSATEIVCALDLRDQLVGVSHECDYPPSVRLLPKVTSTLIPKNRTSAEIDQLVRGELQQRQALYSLDLGVLKLLKPDLIITQALCDVCAVAADEVEVAACGMPSAPRVLNLEPMSLEEVFTTLLLVGDAAGVVRQAKSLVANLKDRVARIVEITSQTAIESTRGLPRVAFLEWIEPPFNGGHWTPELIALVGGVDCFNGAGKPSRTLAWGEVVEAQPDVLFMAPCGFTVERALQDIPYLTKQPGWRELPCVGSAEVFLADGSQFFSRPGPRLVESLEMLAAALHPKSVPQPREGLRAMRLCSATISAMSARSESSVSTNRALRHSRGRFDAS